LADSRDRRSSEFPAAEAVDIPLSNEAQRFYKSGPPFLHDYFREGVKKDADGG
jgi:hypothetical protein